MPRYYRGADVALSDGQRKEQAALRPASCWPKASHISGYFATNLKSMKYAFTIAAVICLFVVGCGPVAQKASSGGTEGSHIGNESQIQFFISERLQLASLNLRHTGDGNYTADAKGTDGLNYDIVIKQTPGEINYTWKNSRSKRGKGTFSY